MWATLSSRCARSAFQRLGVCSEDSRGGIDDERIPLMLIREGINGWTCPLYLVPSPSPSNPGEPELNHVRMLIAVIVFPLIV